MAYNKVILGGFVADEPRFLMNSGHGDCLEVLLKIKRKELGKDEFISVVLIRDNLVSEGLQSIEVGDYMFVSNGRIITTNYNKVSEIVCPHCQDVDYQTVKGEKTEVEVKEFQLLKKEMFVEEADIPCINKVFLIGNVCSDLNYRPSDARSNRDYMKYKLAVDRPGLFGEGVQTGDFPFIVSFHKDAHIANQFMEKSDLVFVEGAIQQRTIRQKHEVNCPICHQSSIIKIDSIVREIITSKIEIMKKVDNLKINKMDEE